MEGNIGFINLHRQVFMSAEVGRLLPEAITRIAEKTRANYSAHGQNLEGDVRWRGFVEGTEINKFFILNITDITDNGMGTNLEGNIFMVNIKST